MTSTTLDVSVVVRTYTEDRWDYLVASLESLERQLALPREVVVVVDHNPTLLARVRERFPLMHIVENTEPRGSSGAWNSGIMASSSKIVAFIDDDAEAAPNWLQELTSPYTDELVLGVGGQISPVWEGTERPLWFPQEFYWIVGCSYRGLPESTAPVRNLIGCNMSFRRSVFEEIGGFRKGMGHVGGRPIGDDETELCIRINRRWPDHVLLHHPGAQVFHKVPASRALPSYYYGRCRLEGRSKALMSRLVGTNHGLSSERAHILRVLPGGFFRGLGDALRGDRSGLGRAWYIAAGLTVTASNYALGAVQQLVAPVAADYEIVPIAPAQRLQA